MTSTTPNPWINRAARLAEFEIALNVRPDAYGYYTAKGPRVGKGDAAKAIRQKRLKGKAVGTFPISIDNMSRKVVLDIDNHENDPAKAKQNEALAKGIFFRLKSIGFEPLLEDSDGRGSFKVRVIFNELIPAAKAHAFGKWIAGDADIESFPKQSRIGKNEYGSWMRGPGPHHKYDHYSRFFDGERWLEGDEAIDHFLDATMHDPALLQQMPGEALETRDAKSKPALSEEDAPRLRSALRTLPDEFADAYDKWVMIGQSVHHASSGDPWGLILWDEFSARSGKYDADACEVKWGSFKADGKRTASTVFHHAREAGWEPDPADDFANCESVYDGDPSTDNAQKDNVWKPKSVRKAVDDPAPPREVVIEGLARRGDTKSIVSGTKLGKSWFATYLAMCVASGSTWLGRRVTKGKVLLLDNELRDEDLQNRFHDVAKAAGLENAIGDGDFEYLALRGQLAGIAEVERQLRRRYKPGELTMIVMDAKYRFFGQLEENSNTDQTAFHNAVDRLALHLNCVIVLIHHSTKGTQASKATADVGAGGGAQSRTVDCHVVIRPHEHSEELAVMDAIVRTFPKFEPVTIRWAYPLWSLEETVEPVLKHDRTQNDVRTEKSSKDRAATILELLRLEPGHTLSESKLSGSHPERQSFRTAIRQLENEDRIEFVPDFKPPRSKKEAPAWKLKAG